MSERHVSKLFAAHPMTTAKYYCPAREDVIRPFLKSRDIRFAEVVKQLTVMPGRHVGDAGLRITADSQA